MGLALWLVWKGFWQEARRILRQVMRVGGPITTVWSAGTKRPIGLAFLSGVPQHLLFNLRSIALYPTLDTLSRICRNARMSCSGIKCEVEYRSLNGLASVIELRLKFTARLNSCRCGQTRHLDALSLWLL